MTLEEAVAAVLESQKQSEKPLAVILAGHNGSGKSTLWYGYLADFFRIPLVNADRMMMSVLPETFSGDGQRRPLPVWASTIRDEDSSWMRVAQKGVEAFVAQAMGCIQLQGKEIFDCRNQAPAVAPAILEWLCAVCPQDA